MVGHADLLLQGMRRGESAASRADIVSSLAADIHAEWAGGQETIAAADYWAHHYRTSTSVMIKEGEELKRSAVASYRKAVLSGLSPSELDQAILKYKMRPSLFSQFKGALSDLTSGKYPQSDLINLTSMTRKSPEVGKSGLTAAGRGEQAIVKAEVKAIQAAGIGATEAEATSSVKKLLSVIKHAKTIAGGEVAIAAFIVENAVGALHQLIVNDPSQAESLARLIEENTQAGKNKNLNNVAVEH